jgi:hypothetical protein
VLRSNTRRPTFNSIRFDFDRESALAANQMVMVAAGSAGSVEALTLLLERVGLTLNSEICECPIHGG